MPALHDRNRLKTEVVHKTVATRTFEWHEIKDLLVGRLTSEMGLRSGTAIDHAARRAHTEVLLKNGAEVTFKVRRVEEGSPSYATDKYEISLTYTKDHAAVADQPSDGLTGTGLSLGD